MANEIIHTDQGSKLSESITLFVAGAAAGAIAALLFAPQAGRETRRQLNKYGKRTSDTMNQWATAAYDLFTDRDKLNGRSRHEEAIQPNERHDLGTKSQTHALAR
jgi:gas vesicle protein